MPLDVQVNVWSSVPVEREDGRAAFVDVDIRASEGGREWGPCHFQAEVFTPGALERSVEAGGYLWGRRRLFVAELTLDNVATCVRGLIARNPSYDWDAVCELLSEFLVPVDALEGMPDERK